MHANIARRPNIRYGYKLLDFARRVFPTGQRLEVLELVKVMPARFGSATGRKAVMPSNGGNAVGEQERKGHSPLIKKRRFERL